MTRQTWDRILTTRIRVVTHAAINENLCESTFLSPDTEGIAKEFARESRDWWTNELVIATSRLKQWIANNPYPEKDRDENPDAYADALAEALRDADRVKEGYR